jgi:hypothetical protein
MKKSFGLLSVLILLIIFSFLSINIIQNQNFSSQIDRLKYLQLQALIYMKNIKNNISYNPNDKRFKIKITSEDINNTATKYNIYISNEENHISLYDNIILNN